MNIAKELEGFREWALVHHVPPSVGKLFHALLLINSTCEWQKRFTAPAKLVEKKSGLAKQTVSVARQILVKHGWIVYEMGCRGKAPMYELFSFIEKVDHKIAYSSASFLEQSMNKSIIVDHSIDPSIKIVQKITPLPEKQENTSKTVDQSTESRKISPQTWTVLKEEEEEERRRRRGGGTRANLAFHLFEENFGMLRPILHESFFAWCEELGDEMVVAAIKLAAAKGGNTYSYLEQILIEWSNAGVQTIDQVRAYEKQKKVTRHPKASTYPKETRTAVFDKFRKAGNA